MLEINSYEKQLNGLIIERDELIDQINELKNIIEKQEIMIDNMKCCENCKHSCWSLISDCIECCHPKKELRNTCDDKYTNWEIIKNEQ